MTEGEMEKLFKSKLTNREFAFNPGNWEKMEAMLDQKATAGGWYFWRSAAAILLFGVVVASVIYYNPGAISQHDAISGPDFISEGKVLPNMKPGTEPNTGSINAEPITFEDAKDLKQASSNEEVSTPVSNENLSSIVTQSTRQNETNNVVANVNASSINNSTEVDPSNENDLETSFGNNETEETFKFVEFLELTSKDYALPQLTFLDFNLKEADFQGYDEKSAAQQKINTSGLFVNTGPVFTGSSASNTFGTGFLAGLGYRKGLNYGFGVETGLNYFVLNNVNIQSHSDSIFYRFGKERIETEEMNSRLDYLEVPLNLTYKLAPKHQLGVGGYAAILLNVSRDITRTTYTSKSGTFVEDDKVSGYLDEFNRFDFGLSAFYRYSVSSRLNVGLHIKQGLLDITHDVSEDYSEDHTNFNTRIVLEYSLF